MIVARASTAQFIAQNARWLGAGLLLTFASGFGQTWFISLFAAEIQAAHGLSDGGWGALYTAATLGSALLLFWRGDWADRIPFATLAPLLAFAFAASAIAFAYSTSVWLLLLAVFGLRFCGQGMFSHTAMTAMGRWFAARRGQAVAITSLGYPIAEVILPPMAVLGAALVGWQGAWLIGAFILALPVALGARWLFSESRARQSTLSDSQAPGLGGRHWQRRDALHHWLFPTLIPVLLTPGFIGTVIFFHQVHIADQKGWTLLAMTPAYTFYAGFAVCFSFISGWLSDRIGPHRLLPAFLLPMGLGIALVWPSESVIGWYASLALIGMSQGISNALAGVLYPFIYGTRHLGSIRSMATTLMVFSTAIGPGITGLLIDQGVPFAAQAPVMGAWCIGLSAFCVWIAWRLNNELRAHP